MINVSQTHVLINHVKQNMINMDDPEVPQAVKDNTEFILNMDNPKRHELELEVKRNQTRVDELQTLRKKLAEKRAINSEPPLPEYNVLIFYLDNISRAHFHRALPKLSEWLSQFTPDKQADLQAVEYFRYHTVGRITSEACNALFYGQNQVSISGDSQYISRFYSENGFITGIQRDECGYQSEQVWKPNASDQAPYAYDHYASAIF